MKARFEMTEVRKAANRMTFGGKQEEDLFTGKGYGMLGSKDSMGKLRIASDDRGLAEA